MPQYKLHGLLTLKGYTTFFFTLISMKIFYDINVLYIKNLEFDCKAKVADKTMTPRVPVFIISYIIFRMSEKTNYQTIRKK